MKKADKVLFDRAKARIEESDLDEHSKAGMSVALEMSGDACNGMATEEKMETLTRAVFSLTLAVGYFMAQAPEHTKEAINTAIDTHVGKCAKLIAANEKGSAQSQTVHIGNQPSDEHDESSVSFSLKDGIKANGAVSWIIGAGIVIFLLFAGLAYLQQSTMNKMMDEKFQALHTEIEKGNTK